ncbi:ATP-dependent RNA helicase HrpA [Methylococcus sp. EFPC2]|uniref:ATP-dependent RNA helicase HrpA n=1 Tax=Methylococcus sp. EFPC2 TaxID=2812648 RepID=UPI00196880F4|nr:ATP-dependent RNA helicase HrpA [Methylococcus sp. EFPC2]QSA99042.1 ATP-dependent RNA helicase HrpA [Methylococcus sp. EFPC2]
MKVADLTAFEEQLGACLRKDQHRCRRTIDRLRNDLKSGKDIAAQLAELQSRLAESAAARKARAASVPALDYPPDLPVSGKKDEILEAILNNQVVIVCGETGSGKTTQLPKICLEAGRGVTGYIGHTQPRRIAARSVAARIAEELRQEIGKAVGYKVRFHDHTSPDSLIKLMTDGILLAETQNDRFLDQYDTLIIDEAHERSLNIDFLLGYMKWLLPRRPDFKLIVTSATIDPERFSRHFGDAPIINVSGRTYPVEIRYRPMLVEADAEDETGDELQRGILSAVDELYRDTKGDILIFLIGERDIRETAESLRKHHPGDCEILPLYSRLSVAEQDRVFRPHGKRRVVLATNVAETSLTVPGIRAVIDAGHARISRYSHRSKLQRLPIENISQASANQRAGRCGRIGPGICIRLYSEADFYRRPEFTDPEILRTNLAAVILQMKALGLGDLADFPFLESPDERMVRDGLRTLQELNAMDDKRRLTEIGKRLAKLPVDPRLGRILLAASDENSLTEVAIIVSALSLQDPRERPSDKAQAADQKHAPFKDENSDFLSYLKLWKAYQEQKKHLSNSKLRQWCQGNFLSYLRMREWEDIHQQILLTAKGELTLRFNQADSEYGEIHRPLLTGLLTNVSLKQEGSEYLGARGVKCQIWPGSALFKPRPKWILSAEQVETTKVYARTVAKIEPEWIERCCAHIVKRHHYEPHWEKKAGRAAILERLTLFNLTVLAGRRVPLENIDPVMAHDLFIRHALVLMEYDSKAPFFVHNRTLLEEAEYLQQKGRRVDLVADEEWIYRFYDERIPQEVVSGVSFEVWRKQAEKKNPQLLFMTREDVTRKEDEALHDQNFPDVWDMGGTKLRLEYRFEPGHEDDGVTVIVPLHVLNQLKPEPFQWLVPGLLREKLVALIKNLPKQTRKHFVPAPDFADKVLPQLDYRQGKLTEQMSASLRRMVGFAVPQAEWSEEGIPLHLRMNFALVDDSGVVLARSRTLSELKQVHAQAAVSNFAELAKEELSMSGCRDWQFGELPERYQSADIQGFPALFDEGETVGLRVFDTPEAAAASQEQGLVRLFRLAMAKELKYLRKNLPLGAPAELAYRQLAAHSFLYPELKPGRDLREDLLDRLMAALYLDNQPDIRTREAFERRLSEGRGDIVGLGNTAARLMDDILILHADLNRKLKGLNSPAGEDMRSQLGHLIYAGFVAITPYPRLKEIPRYLKALQFRLDKALQDANRDARLYAELAPHNTNYWTSVKQGKSVSTPERDDFRWMLEEFRVSLFAQSLKTPYPVSAKRLDEAWRKRPKIV